MENSLISILSIAVSIIIFFITYRQTIGAKRERIKSANIEIEKIILRRIVSESVTPKTIDVIRLIEGKARDFHVKIGDLFSHDQIMNCIYTRIIETDLIPHTQREEILSRIIPALVEAETSPIQDQNFIGASTKSWKVNLNRNVMPLVIGVLASLVGAFVAVIPKIGSNNINMKNEINILLATAAISLTIIIIYYIFNRLKESQQEVTISENSKAIEKAISFERDVAKFIGKAGLKITPSNSVKNRYDFSIHKNGKKILVEVKAWSRPIPFNILSEVVEVLDKTVRAENADEGLVIVKTPIDSKVLDLKGKKIRILTLNEFKNYLTINVK